MAALHAVTDPELDEPITDLGFIRTILVDDDGIEVHLRLPTAFCSPNFAYLMVADALDALRDAGVFGRVTLLLDDHHDSDKINAGLATDAGFVGTFGREAHDSLDELRRIFLCKAHTAAMERCVAGLLRGDPLDANALARLLLRDLPDGKDKMALLRRRGDIGLSMCPNSRVLVDEHGSALAAEGVPMLLRFARTVRISMEGNSHFCRGLLATRYADGGNDDLPQIIDTRTRNPQ